MRTYFTSDHDGGSLLWHFRALRGQVRVRDLGGILVVIPQLVEQLIMDSRGDQMATGSTPSDRILLSEFTSAVGREGRCANIGSLFCLCGTSRGGGIPSGQHSNHNCGHLIGQQSKACCVAKCTEARSVAQMSSPGVEPGLSRPRRDVLTTRRWGPWSTCANFYSNLVFPPCAGLASPAFCCRGAQRAARARSPTRRPNGM